MAGGSLQTLEQFKKMPLAALNQMKSEGEPWALTYGGKPQLIVQDAKAYAVMLDEIDRLETIAAVKQSEKDIRAGRVYVAAQLRKMLKMKYDIAD